MKIRIVKEQNLGSEFPGKEAGKGYTMSREIIDMLRSKVYPKLNDDELEEFGTEMHDHFMAYMKESVNENKSGLERIKFHFDKLFGPDLRFDINRDPNNPERDRIDVRGSQQDLFNFGNDLQGEKMEGFEVFWTDDDDRGQIVRIVKSDSINEKKKKDDRCTRIAKRKYDTWPSAYASGAVVRCRKGEIWKGIK